MFIGQKTNFALLAPNKLFLLAGNCTNPIGTYIPVAVPMKIKLLYYSDQIDISFFLVSINQRIILWLNHDVWSNKLKLKDKKNWMNFPWQLRKENKKKVENSNAKQYILTPLTKKKKKPNRLNHTRKIGFCRKWSCVWLKAIATHQTKKNKNRAEEEKHWRIGHDK